MSFLEKVPDYIAELEKKVMNLSGQRLTINWGHDCDCEYCEERGDADPEADQKNEELTLQIEECQRTIHRLKSYSEMFKKEVGRNDSQFKHTNSRGVTYYLNAKEVTLRAGKKQTIYYFSKDVRPEASPLPSSHRVHENPRNGFLTIQRIEQ